MKELQIHSGLEDHAMRAASVMEHTNLLALDDFIAFLDGEFTARNLRHSDEDDCLVGESVIILGSR